MVILMGCLDDLRRICVGVQVPGIANCQLKIFNVQPTHVERCRFMEARWYDSGRAALWMPGCSFTRGVCFPPESGKRRPRRLKTRAQSHDGLKLCPRLI